MNNLLEAALQYRSMGLSVIPLSPKSKIPPKGFSPIPYRERIATEDEIRQWWKDEPNYNVGIVTGKLSGVFVIDLDKYADDYSEESEQNIIGDSIVCPTVETPRKGQHLYYSYPENFNPTIGARVAPGIDFRGEGGYILAPPSVNEKNIPYKWVITFDRAILPALSASFLKEASNRINTNTLYKEPYIPYNSENFNLTNPYIPYKILQKGKRDSDLFTVANALIKNKLDLDFTRQVIGILAQNCNPPFPEGEAETKIKSALDRAKRHERNLTDEIREFVSLHEGYFDLTSLYTTLQILTSQEKNNAGVVINRLCKEGVIRKYGNKRGCYEPVIEQEENIIDLTTADNTCLVIKYPLGVHELVKTMPKNIIIVAGESNAGKTAMLLNIAARNMFDHEVVYFTSEMGGAELKERLQNFVEKLPMQMWSHCKFIERASDFDIAIRPDAINIIDFLEVHDEFYKIGGLIKKIFDKLNKGIAIIAIQKNPGRDDGLGGQRSIEKARLYISMSPGKIKIVKAKNWVSGLMNPNGLCKNYKLVKGMIFKEDSEWYAG